MILVSRVYEFNRVAPEGIAVDRIISINKDPEEDLSWIKYSDGGGNRSPSTSSIRVLDRVEDLVYQIQRVKNGG